MSFAVNGMQQGAVVLLSMLCSYENVGSAAIWFSGNADTDDRAPLLVDLKWAQRSSQQCIQPVGKIGPGKHTLHLRTLTTESPLRGRNQVKVFGIYTQPLAL